MARDIQGITTPDTIGPQYGGDDPFRARMRLHQSWWRAFVLGEGFGVGPNKTSPNRYGNILEQAAGERGGNFLTSEIQEVALARIAAGGGVDRYRCVHNLLSSQPMCFNLFGPASARPDLATRLFTALFPDEVAEVERVVVEYAPPKAEHLDDATSFDAFVVYRRTGGGRGFLAIETKLTEPFSQEEYGPDHRPRYRQLTEDPDGPWRQGVGDRVADRQWNQVWRNHMLAESLVRGDDAFEHGVPIVVHHPDDTNAVAAVEGYREFLREPGSLVRLDLRQVVDAWRPLVEGDDRAWIDAFDARYLHLELSAAWMENARR